MLIAQTVKEGVEMCFSRWTRLKVTPSERINETESSGQLSRETKLVSFTFYHLKKYLPSYWQEAMKLGYIINIHIMHTITRI